MRTSHSLNADSAELLGCGMRMGKTRRIPNELEVIVVVMNPVLNEGCSEPYFDYSNVPQLLSSGLQQNLQHSVLEISVMDNEELSESKIRKGHFARHYRAA